MIGAERLLVDRQRLLEQRPSANDVATQQTTVREVAEGRRRIRMLSAPLVIEYAQSSQEKPLRARQVAARLERPGEIVECCRRVGMVGIRLFANRKRTLEQPFRPQVFALGLIELA